jgi:predicted nucleic acid-binding protein
VLLYLDTSSLVKLYVEESSSAAVREAVSASELLATSRIAFVEGIAALARRRRMGDIDEASFALLAQAMADDWAERIVRVEVDEYLAADLAVRQGLRALDAIHLAAVLTLTRADAAADVRFSSFDAALNRAAAAEGVVVLEV